MTVDWHYMTREPGNLSLSRGGDGKYEARTVLVNFKCFETATFFISTPSSCPNREVPMVSGSRLFDALLVSDFRPSLACCHEHEQGIQE